MSNVLGDSSSRNWGRDATSPLRRSARLSAVSSPRPARTDRSLGTPASESISRVRLQDKGGGVPDASAWGSSLYSARSARDPSLVSSYYLRSSQPDASGEGDAGASFADESSDVFGGLGSLLRGSQRPPQTPKSSVRHASVLSGEADDYTQEDQFMARVEDQWRTREGASDASPLVGAARGSQAPAATPIKTPHVPGVFRSAGRARRVDPNESQATEDASFTETSFAKRPTFEQTEQEQEAKPTAAHTLGTIPRLLLAGALVVLVYWVFFAPARVQLPTVHKAAPPLVEKPWPTASSSVHELRKRIDTLENAVNKVWRSFGDVGAEMKQHHNTLSERLRALEGRAALSASVQALESQVQALRAAHRESAAMLAAEKEQTESLLARVASVERRGVSHGASEVNAADSIRESITELEVRIARAARQAEQAGSAASEAQSAVDALRSVVPEEMPVQYDRKTGQLRVDPALYHELRKVLGASEKARPPAKPGSWAAFLDTNRGELETMFASAIKEHLHARTASGMLLDRESFLSLLQSELVRAKTELSTRFNENVHSLQNDILAKVRQQQEMYERSGSWQKPSEHWDSPFLHDSVRSSGEVAGLIDAALSTFAADQIARADYAQYSAGGRVIPSLTSPTHEMRLGGSHAPSVWSLLHTLVPLPGWGATGPPTVRGRMPAVALHHDNSPGMCWPFSGTHGQLGIQLVRKIHVEAITVDHLPQALALDGSAAAPRDMEAWGIVETEQERRQLARWRSGRAHLDEWDEPTPVPPTPSHVYLGAFSYDTSGAAIQTFPVSSEGAAVGLPFRVVQLNVLSNHGLREFTCVYRVRVHGQPVDS